MRALSKRAAARCETAKNKTCRCRCGGLLHGSMRNLIEEGREANPEFFEQLPEGDPHHVRSREEKRQRTKMAREKIKAARAELAYEMAHADDQLPLWEKT